MAIVTGKPDADGLGEILEALRTWQQDDAPLQLHPGDVGWFWRTGVDTTAAAVRTWSRDGRIVAIGLLDGPGLLRLATAPDALRDEELAARLAADIDDPERGILPAGKANIEAAAGASVREALAEAGWQTDEPWTQLRRNLAAPVRQPALRIETVGPAQAHVFAEVQRAAFEGSTFSEERWHALAAGPAFADARCLVGYDDGGDAVAACMVWSAGPGRPGLLEPMGVHRNHRGLGHGVSITLAAAAALRALDASSAIVATASANTAAVATYTKAGFVPEAEVLDLCRV
ncbi:GNAT family N-acetyltransferase [Yinghuangia soli]|uniref:GNAT family N-acetyltransferase n=1 Tax=Yinghuangia soli TaxID=2908204 RepID=A0AA41Q1M3_9ACTN|nr:GNAT family N-acetyltransferase [Yinghuangia soli]MCF2528417.1 GNAT family N-acetyltransferase [Yinghuangia soli]